MSHNFVFNPGGQTTQIEIVLEKISRNFDNKFWNSDFCSIDNSEMLLSYIACKRGGNFWPSDSQCVSCSAVDLFIIQSKLFIDCPIAIFSIY